MSTVEIKGVQFKVFDSLTFKAERDAMYKLTGQTGKQFNQFVRDSVYFFFHGGNHQVAILNEVLKVAYQAKGMDHTRLLGYLACIVPHTAVDARKGKDKVTGNLIALPPRFGEKAKGKEYNWEEALDFLARNPYWGDWGREISHKAFSLDTSVEKVVALLIKNSVNVEEFVNKVKAVHSLKVAGKTAK